MKKKSILALDLLRKEEIASLKGGTASTNNVCTCVCIGPVTPYDKDKRLDIEISSPDEDCTDSGASNAHRASNDEVTLK